MIEIVQSPLKLSPPVTLENIPGLLLKNFLAPLALLSLELTFFTKVFMQIVYTFLRGRLKWDQFEYFFDFARFFQEIAFAVLRGACPLIKLNQLRTNVKFFDYV